MRHIYEIKPLKVAQIAKGYIQLLDYLVQLQQPNRSFPGTSQPHHHH